MAKNKVMLCKSCNTAIAKKAKVCPNCGAKNKKPFYKKGWFIVLAIFVVLIAVISIGGGKEYENIAWDSLELSSLLPAPELDDGEIKGILNYDSDDLLSLNFAEMSKDDFNSYVNTCKKAGFNNDSTKTSSNYSACNKEGYELIISYYESDEEISVHLSAPFEETESEVGNEVEDKTETTTETPKVDKDIRPKFKEAMDSYEEFMNEYVEFMEKYENSNGNDLSLLADYADYMSKYAEFVEDFDKWDDEELTLAETNYYLEVQTRVNKKLLEVSN